MRFDFLIYYSIHFTSIPFVFALDRVETDNNNNSSNTVCNNKSNQSLQKDGKQRHKKREEGGEERDLERVSVGMLCFDWPEAFRSVPRDR